MHTYIVPALYDLTIFVVMSIPLVAVMFPIRMALSTLRLYCVIAPPLTDTLNVIECHWYTVHLGFLYNLLFSQCAANNNTECLVFTGDAAVSDSRPYICSLCGKRSNWKWDVKKHILSVHKGSMGSILDELLNKVCVL